MTMLILTDPLSSHALKNVAKCVSQSNLTIDSKQRHEFVSLVDRLGQHSRLRNDIAHCRWAAGSKIGTIRAQGLSVRSGVPKLKGKQSKSWTSSDLKKVGDELLDLNVAIATFANESGLYERTKSATDALNAEIKRQLAKIEGDDGTP